MISWSGRRKEVINNLQIHPPFISRREFFYFFVLLITMLILGNK